ncbi:putative amidase C869.01 [Vitis vinifera]|uniref:Putative amidase C869.01 n=1 Tax=Vitis vinifera TaxID=29760 RepID=A0A438DT03_VITVI|nr:putative amidase C869.01 [Vitis vinifera]
MNTTAGSFALLKSVVPRDAGVVRKLRKAGAIILGKASLSEWAAFRATATPSGWCARTGQGKNPYVLSATPCGSSSGSAISVAANLAAVSLGTETDGSILCPSHINSVVGIKPTLVSPAELAWFQSLLGRTLLGRPICRTVSDAVEVLDVIVGFDYRDEATRTASKYIPQGGYKQFLNANGLKGKRLGIVRNPFYMFGNGSVLPQVFEHHFHTLRQGGAILVDHLEIANIDVIYGSSGEYAALEAEFKTSLNAYLKELVASPVRTLADVIAFNNKFSNLVSTFRRGKDKGVWTRYLSASRSHKWINKKTLLKLARLSRNGFEKLMKEHKLDALVTPGSDVRTILAIGGFPGISVPAGYDSEGVPFAFVLGA